MTSECRTLTTAMFLHQSIPAHVRSVTPAGAVLGEGPTWDAATGSVYWVDIKGRRLHACAHPTGEARSWHLPFRLCSLARAAPPWEAPADLAGDVFIGCGDPGLMWLALEGDRVTWRAILHPEPDLPGNRFNDGKFGPDGRYWAGTMDDAEHAASGCLYAFSADGTFQRLDAGYLVTNGPAFSPDGRTVYHTDSALQRIYAFDLKPGGRLAQRRVLRQFEPGEGYPDGMTTDAEGNLWVAMWDGHRLQRLDSDGRDTGAVALPVARPTSCVLVEPGVLYVTSASIGVEGQSGAGSLFRVELG